MKKVIECENNNYIDSTSIVHKRTPLNQLLEGTGWIALPLASGITKLNEANKPMYKKTGDDVTLQGIAMGVSTGGTVIGTIPNELKSRSQVALPCRYGSNGDIATILIDSLNELTNNITLYRTQSGTYIATNVIHLTLKYTI